MRKDHDPFDITDSDPVHADKRIRERLYRETEESDLKWLMSSKRGRRIVWRHMEEAGVFRPSFNTNAMQMAFNEGFRNYGNRTLMLVHTYCPELYPQMMKENTNVRGNGDANHNNQ